MVVEEPGFNCTFGLIKCSEEAMAVQLPLVDEITAGN
jgi:hypothetical protein